MKKLYILLISVLMLALVLSFSACSCSTDAEPGSGSSSNQPQQNNDVGNSISADGRLSFTISADKSYYTVAGLKDVSSLLTIPSEHNGKPVKAIGERAFENFTKLEKVTIPDSITTIDEYAFAGCTSIKFITIPKSVTEIGEGVFRSCQKLEYIEVDSANPSYKSEKGNLCSKDGKTFIQYSIGRPNSEKPIIPSTVRSISSYAFENCQVMKEIEIPEGVETIGGNAFYNCDKLEKVSIPKSVRGIGKRAFSNCNSLAQITVEDTNNVYKSIDGSLYGASKEVLVQYAIGKEDKSFVVPSSVNYIHSYAFEGCTNLEDILISKTVTKIGDNAFAGYTALTIRCGASSKPRDWDDSWNPDNCTVVWGNK